MHSPNILLAVAQPRAASSASSAPTSRLPEATTLTLDEIRRIVHDIVG